MFAYCNNNPVNFLDNTGARMVYVKFDCGAPVGFPSPSAVTRTSPASSNRKKINLPVEFALAEGTSTANGGIKTASVLSGELDAYSFGDDGFNLLSMDVSAVSLDLENERRTLSLFDLGNASASVGIGVLPYASVLVSLWSPSVTFSLFNKQVTIALHVGAAGMGYKYTPSEAKVTFANGIGMSIGVT